jgi:hypothetical protein
MLISARLSTGSMLRDVVSDLHQIAIATRHAGNR